MSAKTIPIRVTKTIAADYARRGVFPQLRPGQQWFCKTLSNGDLFHVDDYKLAFRVLDDAYEQEWVRRGRHGVGITLSYGALARHTLDSLRWALDFDPGNIFSSTSGRYEPDFGSLCGSPVDGLLRRLGIPPANAQTA